LIPHLEKGLSSKGELTQRSKQPLGLLRSNLQEEVPHLSFKSAQAGLDRQLPMFSGST
jgi:hypothetical protein